MTAVYVGGADADIARRYVAAVAELPLRTRRADAPASAVVVVSGRGRWADAARTAAADGAVAVVVADPGFLPAADVSRLSGELDIPVVVERPLLRADLAGDAAAASPGVEPRVMLVDASGPASALLGVIRDALGWLRVLAGEDVAVVASHGGLALCETAGGVPATVSIVVSERPGPGWIRAQALGETSRRMEVDGRTARVVTDTVEGSRTAPFRYESSERLALRRAVDAVASPVRPYDLQELLADSGWAERMRDAAGGAHRWS